MSDLVIHNCAGGIGYFRGKFLFVRNTKDEVILPKGHLEDGESNVNTAVREFKEETGFTDFKDPEFLGTLTYSRFEKETEHKFKINIFLFLLNNDDALEKESVDGKKLENVWVEVDEADQFVTHKNLVPFINKAKSLLHE